MADNFITIGDLDLVNVLEDHYKLLIDDSTNGDTKAALVGVLKDYLTLNMMPSIDGISHTWYIGDVNTGISATGVELRYSHPHIQYKFTGIEEWITIFDITVLLPEVTIDDDTLCWKINGILTDKSAVNARINSMNGNVSIMGSDGIIVTNDTENNIITISRTGESDNGIPPADVPSKVIRASNGQLIIKWTDPSDLTADGVTYSIWDHTTLVRKIGSYPVDETDGDIIVINYIKNQYAENGYVDSNLTNGIAYYYKLFIYSIDGTVNRNQKNNMIGIPKNYFIYGVRIDETNSNPETAVIYTDDAIGMSGGSSDWELLPLFANIQPCVLKDGSVQYYLNKNNYNYKANGVDLADISTGNDGDVMIEFPKTAYMIYREENYLYIKVTNDPDAKLADERFCFFAHTRDVEGDREKLYVGAYGGCILNSKLRSLSGNSVALSQPISAYRSLVQLSGEGYDIFSFYPLILIQCLFLIKYKNLNSQLVLGNGAAGGTGTLNGQGFNYGIPNAAGKIKLFGIEDFWGAYWNFIDGIKVNSNRQAMTSFNNFNDDANNYTTYSPALYPTNTSSADSFIIKTQGTRELGFTIKDIGGSTTTYYCDGTAIYTNGVGIYGGMSGSTNGGIFSLRLYNTVASYTNISARMMYL